jgi:hypothetical protein
VLTSAAGTFLVLTLTSTALAKLRRPRATAQLISHSLSVPPAVGTALTATACSAELGLAALICLRRQSAGIGILLVLLFLSFAAYPVLAHARSGVSSCACAGPTQVDRAPLVAAVGHASANVLLAAVSGTWAASSHPADAGSVWLPLLGLAVPLLAVVVGWTRTRKRDRAVKAAPHPPTTPSFDTQLRPKLSDG